MCAVYLAGLVSSGLYVLGINWTAHLRCWLNVRNEHTVVAKERKLSSLPGWAHTTNIDPSFFCNQ